MPREEVYLIEKHLVLMAEIHKAEEIRYWGKIFGTNQDYYILQGRVNPNIGL